MELLTRVRRLRPDRNIIRSLSGWSIYHDQGTNMWRRLRSSSKVALFVVRLRSLLARTVLLCRYLTKKTWRATAKKSETDARTAYLLAYNEKSRRTRYSCILLERIGFDVKVISSIQHEDPVMSNRVSMQSIYNKIANGKDEWAYVFEDDINVLSPILLNEIIEYEDVSDLFFYLGLCKYSGEEGVVVTNSIIRGHDVFSVSGFVRGLHAIALSKHGAQQILDYSLGTDERYMDVTLENFSKLYPANVVRYDLESYIPGHKGVIFQDRARFQSDIG